MAESGKNMAGRAWQALERLNPWVITVIGLGVTAAVGAIDYITDDYSILVAYMLPVAFTAWFAGRWRSAAICLTAGVIRYLADMALVGSLFLHLWNATADTLFLFIVGFLVALLRRAIG